MTRIIYNFPSSICFNWGETTNVSKYVRSLNIENILIVTDEGVEKAGILERVISPLMEEEINFTVFKEVEPNPTYLDVENGLKSYRDNDCDSVLALGGGSPMDAAKGILVMVNHPGSLEDYYGGAENPRSIGSDIPGFIAIPTTSGTGSEVSRGAIITDHDNRKRVLGSQYLLPRTVILDPELTVSMPPKLTAYTGLDALSHNLEAFSIDSYAPLCDAFAREAFQLISKSLLKAYLDGKDRNPRMDMMMASTMGALAFQKGLGVVHSLAHQLSTQVNIPHGAACGIMMPHAIKFNLKEKSTWEKYSEIARIFGSKQTTVKSDAMILSEEISILLDDMQIPKHLSDWNVSEEDIEVMAKNAMLDHCHNRNPRKCTLNDMKELYVSAM